MDKTINIGNPFLVSTIENNPKIYFDPFVSSTVQLQPSINAEPIMASSVRKKSNIKLEPIMASTVRRNTIIKAKPLIAVTVYPFTGLKNEGEDTSLNISLEVYRTEDLPTSVRVVLPRKYSHSYIDSSLNVVSVSDLETRIIVHHEGDIELYISRDEFVEVFYNKLLDKFIYVVCERKNLNRVDYCKNLNVDVNIIWVRRLFDTDPLLATKPLDENKLRDYMKSKNMNTSEYFKNK
jgi:hypothetical protein